MGNDRQYHTMVTLPDGRVLTAGGRGKGVGGHRALVHTSTEIYDPVTGEWTFTGDLAEGRRKHLLAVLPGGSVLAAGGSDLSGFEAIRTAEIWDPENSSWSPAGETRQPRAEHVAILLADGRVLVTGGLGVKKAAEIFDPATMSWTEAPDMVEARYRHAAALLSDDRVLIAGGNGDQEALSESELFVP